MASATSTAETRLASPESGLAAVRALVAEVRASCLWFLASDFLPESREEALTVLRSIERHGDRETYVRARELREWLSQTSSATSADSSPAPASSKETATSRRFFPLVEHPDFGLTMHPFDLATNKVLALVGRLEVRDWVDTMACSDPVRRVGLTQPSSVPPRDLPPASCAADPRS